MQGGASALTGGAEDGSNVLSLEPDCPCPTTDELHDFGQIRCSLQTWCLVYKTGMLMVPTSQTCWNNPSEVFRTGHKGQHALVRILSLSLDSPAVLVVCWEQEWAVALLGLGAPTPKVPLCHLLIQMPT